MVAFSQNDEFIKYERDNGSVILYSKKFKNIYYLKKLEYEIWNMIEREYSVNSIYNYYNDIDHTEINSCISKIRHIKTYNKDSCIEKNKSNVNKRIYMLERFFLNGILSNVINFLITYCSFPIFILGVLLCKNKINIFLLSNSNISLKEIPMILIIGGIAFFISLILHEIGHAVSAIKRGAFVPEIGIEIRKGIIIAYTKIAEINNVKNKNSEISIHLAGISMNILIAGIFLIIQIFIDNANRVANIIIIINILIACFNFSIYLDSDGSSILRCIINTCEINKENNCNSKKNNNKIIIIFSAIFLNLILPIITVLFTIFKFL